MHTSTPRRGDLVLLRGPAHDQLVLVLSHSRTGREPADVLVVPAWPNVDRANATKFDVLCPPDAATGLQSTVALAAWATATVPAVCLGATIGHVDDQRVIDGVRDVRLAIADSDVKPVPELVGHLEFTKGSEPKWHSLLTQTMSPYWNGSLAEECQRESVAKSIRSDWPDVRSFCMYADTAFWNSDVAAWKQEDFANLYAPWISASTFTVQDVESSEETIDPRADVVYYFSGHVAPLAYRIEARFPNVLARRAGRLVVVDPHPREQQSGFVSKLVYHAFGMVGMVYGLVSGHQPGAELIHRSLRTQIESSRLDPFEQRTRRFSGAHPKIAT